MSLRIMHVINGLDEGGAQRVLVSLVRDLATRGAAQRVVATTRGGRYEAELYRLGVPASVYGMRGPWDVGLLPWVRQMVGEFRPDVIHSHLWLADVAALFGGRGRWSRPKLISTVHNSGVRLHPAMRLSAPLLYQGFDRLLPVSSAVARALRRRHVATPMTVVPVSTISVAESVPKVPQAHNQKCPTVLFAGRISPEKRLDLLVALAGRMPKVRFVVAGDGPLMSWLSRRVVQLGLDCVELLGWRDDVGALLAASDVVMLCSDSEGLPQVLVEAMAGSRAVVATRVGGVPELVEHNTTGLLVPAGDINALYEALLSVLQNPERRREMGAAGRSRFELYFSRERMVNAVVEAYGS